jgi:hypothetical protein
MKREYTTLTRKRCEDCGERLEYNTCWPQNIPVDSEGWGYWYCSDVTCRQHTTPLDEHDLHLGISNRRPRRTDTFIEWDTITL